MQSAAQCKKGGRQVMVRMRDGGGKARHLTGCRPMEGYWGVWTGEEPAARPSCLVCPEFKPGWL